MNEPRTSSPAPLTSNFGNRILILAAHPDDEVVACAAASGRAKQKGSEVFVFYLTNGCIARETLWPWQRKNYVPNLMLRFSEAEQTARLLGLAPVGWSSRPARHLWRSLPTVLADVRQAVAAHKIDQLWVPAYEGGNADHDALNAIGHVLNTIIGKERQSPPPLTGSGPKVPDARRDWDRGGACKAVSPPPVLEFAEYNFSGGKTRSQEFPLPNGSEQIIILTPEEQKKKRAALALYVSEKQNLNYVRVEHECYRPLAAYDYSKPPHPGKLWYARFQWIPFRHPRADFTKPKEVSAAIKTFFDHLKSNGIISDIPGGGGGGA
jgi:LmbE family N-acetylglucosaminyl deacetylase